MPKLFYFFVRGCFLFISPILIILLSFVWALTTPQLHNNTLESSAIYTRISNELVQTQINDISNPSFFDIVWISVINQSLNPGWLQNLSNQNITNFSDWVMSDQDSMKFYFPVQDLERSLEEELDLQAQLWIDSGNAKICNSSVSTKLQEEGFSLEQELCLPPEVYEKQALLSSYLKNSNSNQPIVDTISDIDLNTEQNQYLLNDFEIANYVLTLRDIIKALRQAFWYILIVYILSFIGLVVYAWRVKLYVWRELRFLCWSIITPTLFLSFSALLFVWLSGKSSQFIDRFLKTEIINDKIFELISELILRISFNFFLFAIIFSLLIFFVIIIAWLGEKFYTFKDYAEKNQKIASHKSDYSPEKNQTMDSQFHRDSKVPVSNKDIEPEYLADSAYQSVPTDSSYPTTENIDKDKFEAIAKSASLSSVQPVLHNDYNQKPPMADYYQPTTPNVASTPQTTDSAYMNPAYNPNTSTTPKPAQTPVFIPKTPTTQTPPPANNPNSPQKRWF